MTIWNECSCSMASDVICLTIGRKFNFSKYIFDGMERIERKDDDNAAAKKVNAAEPTVFDDEGVTMTMAQTLIKMKAKKERILDEQMAKRLHDEEVKKAAARERQEQDDLKSSQELQQQYAQARKNTIVYLKNMAGYKMAHFRGMTYDQESFKKLRAEVKVSGSHSTQDTPTDDPKEMSKEDVKNMLEIVPLSKFKVKALQVKHDIFMFIEKDYPLADAVMILMLSTKLQVDEDYEMARDLVMKIFIEANKPKSRRSLHTSSK
nr:hypothetical protein [Tanacetum cinerariifolium]